MAHFSLNLSDELQGAFRGGHRSPSLWLGLGFAITPTGYAATAARATVCTTLSASFGGMTVWRIHMHVHMHMHMHMHMHARVLYA